MQKFIEYIRSEKYHLALFYARKYMKNLQSNSEFQSIFGLLAYKNPFNTKLAYFISN